MCIKKLVSQTYLDIKEFVKENPNDMDLGKVVRAYVRQKEEEDDEENSKSNHNTYDEGLK